ncbi:MAG: type II secretion system protein [Methanomassiliicoccales archaeon]|jgi:prepilin-type N-terminal cleavage/methylation domain-containing protein
MSKTQHIIKNGFTLIEALMAFVVISIIVSFVFIGILGHKKINAKINTYKSIEEPEVEAPMVVPDAFDIESRQIISTEDNWSGNKIHIIVIRLKSTGQRFIVIESSIPNSIFELKFHL